jgi:hypothetical protein
MLPTGAEASTVTEDGDICWRERQTGHELNGSPRYQEPLKFNKGKQGPRLSPLEG